jgi:hypothetical protein
VTRVLAVCFPATDLTFGERVRRAVDRGPWDLASPEGIALMQALLRESYPMATVLLRGAQLGGGWRPTLVLDVHRDGSTEPGDLRVRRAAMKEKER